MSDNENLYKIEKAYDDFAKEWAKEFFNEHAKKPKDREILLDFARAIGARSPVWDIGCGPGNTTRYLHDLGVAISGMDISEKILAEARACYPKIFFQKGNCLKLDFADNSIAGIVAFYTIVHFTAEQVEIMLREIFRVLKPDGILLLTYHVGEGIIHLDEFLGKQVDIDFMFFPTDFITGCLNKAGFVKHQITEREPYAGIEYQSKRAYVFTKKPI